MNSRHLPATPIRGLIFDLDGTLVDSGLDFDAMRREMGLPLGQPILEALAHLPVDEQARCRDILHRHEWGGAERARLMPGVREFLDELARRGILQAVLTRNSREVVLATLDRLQLQFELVVAREDAPAKPNPTGIWNICAAWDAHPREVAMIGDFHLDIEAGCRAGVWTVLYLGPREPDSLHTGVQADRYLHCFHRSEDLLAWIQNPA